MVGLQREDTAGGLYELGGPRVYTMRELMQWVLNATERHRPLFTVGHGLARLQAAIGEMLPGKPFTRDQLAMLGRDNVVAPGAKGLAELGIEPVPIELVVPRLPPAIPAGWRQALGPRPPGERPDRT